MITTQTPSNHAPEPLSASTPQTPRSALSALLHPNQSIPHHQTHSYRPTAPCPNSPRCYFSTPLSSQPTTQANSPNRQQFSSPVCCATLQESSPSTPPQLAHPSPPPSHPPHTLAHILSPPKAPSNDPHSPPTPLRTPKTGQIGAPQRPTSPSPWRPPHASHTCPTRSTHHYTPLLHPLTHYQSPNPPH